MKTKINLTVFAILSMVIIGYTQTPQSIRYQAVARDASGNAIPDQMVSFRISILQGSESGPSVYTETHASSTNALGLVNISIGQGIIESGNFSTISWGSSTYFIQTEMDRAGGTVYQLMGTSQLLSVPYSLYAEKAGNAFTYYAGTGLSLTGTTFNSVWTENSGNIYKNNSGNVGIGLPNPEAQLHTTGTVKFTGLSGTGNIVGIDGSGNLLKTSLTGMPAGTPGQTLRHDGTNWVANSLLYNNGTNIGIGTAIPNFKLEVSGSDASFNGVRVGKGAANISTNTAVGFEVLNSDATHSGSFNTSIGYHASFAGITNRNTAIGYNAMYNEGNVTGYDGENVAVGYEALKGSVDCFSGYCVAIGSQSLYSLENSYYCTAIGYQSLYSATFAANANTAIGSQSLFSNTTGTLNTAIGNVALYSNITGGSNVASGDKALYSNKASFNTAHGASSLYTNISGHDNTASGYQALFSSTGNYNTGTGSKALYGLGSGTNNTAMGYQALNALTTGSSNTAMGYNCALNGNHTQSTFLGAGIDISTSRTNVSVLGYGVANAQCTANNQVLLGNTSITAIRAQVASITAYSDGRFKTNVSDNVHGLDFITKLKPVTYNENPEILHEIWGTEKSALETIDHSDIKKQRFIGFIAQDVEKAAKDCGFEFPGIDIPANEKEVYALRYGDFIMPMVKAIQEQQKTIEDQQKKIDDLESKLNELREIMVKTAEEKLTE